MTQGNYVSAPFEKSIQHLFEGYDKKSSEFQKDIFSSNIRSLLVHNILLKSKHSYLLNDVFDDLVLHDETNHHSHLITLFDCIRKSKVKNGDKVPRDGDIRSELCKKWAKLINIFKPQPIDTIKFYFGESVAFYFAWIEIFIKTSILPTIIGVIFFIVGIVISRLLTNRLAFCIDEKFMIVFKTVCNARYNELI
ncbi:unnamed protein product [Brachionus calyciflorus]|uniref:Anoctamin n=1 Tax=Brachionus calyciflorus TaxID=104777 RepID=A0A814AC93_9BILA|nr:unnamed protein product [Brachionus calyciflorus]